MGVGKFHRADSTTTSSLYEPSLERLAASRAARFLARHCDVDRVALVRRANYAYWLEAIKEMDECHALFSDWPEDAVPYMFPLVLHQPARHFHLLKHLGVPIWRWDEVAITDCAVSMAYSRSLLHMPCHQGLQSQSLQWMTECLRQVLRQA